MDEASGMAASGNVLAVSGHFTGNLSAEMTDGTKKTIRNSNVPPGDLPALADQFHPNVRDASAHTGVDDGFVIKADASTGKAHWIVHYPQSNSDAQIVGVDVDASGNVYGSGYECAVAAGETAKMCHGIVAKFAAADGAVAWERKFSDLGAALWLKHDASDDSIYFTATTTYGGSANGKAHANCEHASCAVTARLSASDGTTDWIRTFQASPRWGVFDQSGDIELAAPADGPYLYAAFDDAAEIGAVTLDAGTPYAGCKAADGAVTPEYEMDISTSKRITADDCPPGSTFVAQTDADAVPAAAAKTYVLCGDKTDGDACIVKYHKYTGLPVWSKDLPMVAGLAVMPDGKSIMATGWYYYSWPESGRTFGDRVLPGYLRAGGLGSQRWGIYHAKLTTAAGQGAYVLHSGGGLSDRVYDMVVDAEGNTYSVGYTKSSVMNWAGPGGLQTRNLEQGGQADDTKTSPVTSEETHLFVAKLASAEEAVPECLSACSGTTDTATITSGSCFIDGVCYLDGDTAEAFGAPCHQCDAASSQTEWTPGSSQGTTHCFVDGICWEDEARLFTQRRTHSNKVLSSCQYCSPEAAATAWSIKAGYELVDGACAAVSPSPPPHTGTFTDDHGTTHVWWTSNPTVVAGAFQAFTLIDMGLPASQVIGTFGERGTSGSNVNGVYANYNKVTYGVDHAASPYAAPHFPTDPTAEEQALLAQKIDVSPSCSGANDWCSEFNVTILDEQGWPDIIVAGPLFAAFIIDDEVTAKAAERGVPIILLDDTAAGKQKKSFIEIAERFEELAAALGADTRAATAAARQAFCRSAEEFKESARAASERGVRALAGVVPFGTPDQETGDIGGWLQSPDRNPALTMLEALGMQILHTDTAQGNYYEAHFAKGWPDYTGDMSATNLMSSGSLTGVPVPYHVDFWLYEPRVALDFTSDAFAVAWPHPAVAAKQYAVYPITTLEYSYGHASSILDTVGNKLKDAAKLIPADVRGARLAPPRVAAGIRHNCVRQHPPPPSRADHVRASPVRRGRALPDDRAGAWRLRLRLAGHRVQLVPGSPPAAAAAAAAAAGI